MRRWKSSELEARIQEKMPAVNSAMLASGRRRKYRRRPRNKEEQALLDLICIKKWKKDIARGKVKKISRRKWYYEFD